MSDQLAAAAAALNVPESLVQRSAEARAKASGGSVDDILAAWAGGGSAPAPAAPPAAEEPAEVEPETTQPETAAPEPSPEADRDPTPTQMPEPAPAASAPVATAVAAPARPPVLQGRTDRPFLVAIGALAALALSLAAGLLAPSTPEEGTAIYTSAVPLDANGEMGRQVYLEVGCGACHTQVVRPLVVDAGLGGVTIADSNQVLGTRRFGPDLTDVASRAESASMFTSVLAGDAGHPAYTGLADADIDALVAYLSATNADPTEDEASQDEETES